MINDYNQAKKIVADYEEQMNEMEIKDCWILIENPSPKTDQPYAFATTDENYANRLYLNGNYQYKRKVQLINPNLKYNMVDLTKLEKQLDDALNSETEESLRDFLNKNSEMNTIDNKIIPTREEAVKICNFLVSAIPEMKTYKADPTSLYLGAITMYDIISEWFKIKNQTK